MLAAAMLAALCCRSVVFTNRTTLKITPLDIMIDSDIALRGDV